jgi:hypothetical protein
MTGKGHDVMVKLPPEDLIFYTKDLLHQIGRKTDELETSETEYPVVRRFLVIILRILDRRDSFQIWATGADSRQEVAL